MAHKRYKVIALMPSFCVQPVNLVTKEGLKAGFKRLEKSLKKKITSQSKRYIREDARENFTITDSSMKSSTEQKGEGAKRNGERPRNQDGAMTMAASTEKKARDPPRPRLSALGLRSYM